MSHEQINPTTQELATQRTEWASERTRMANERTLIAWLRTGLAVTAFGAVVPRLLVGIENVWLIRLVSIIFVFSGTLILFFGVRGYREMALQMKSQHVGVRWWLVALLAGALQIGAILILVLFLLG